MSSETLCTQINKLTTKGFCTVIITTRHFSPRSFILITIWYISKPFIAMGTCTPCNSRSSSTSSSRRNSKKYNKKVIENKKNA